MTLDPRIADGIAELHADRAADIAVRVFGRPRLI
jgi:hypothetical protein